MTDEREGLPSASNKWLMQCLGSGELIRNLPPIEEEVGDDAKIGTKRHDLIENRATEFDDQGDEYTVTKALELRGEAIDIIYGGSEDSFTEMELKSEKEQRLWLIDDSFQKVLSGKFDEVIIGFDKAIMIDYKTMFANYGHAKDNWQLRIYAIMIHEKYGVDEVYTALIQPNLDPADRLTMCKYTKRDIEKAKDKLLSWISKFNMDKQPLETGPHCLYCPAKLQCPKHTQESLEVSEMVFDLEAPTTVEILSKIDLAEKYLGDLKKSERAKALAQLSKDPEALPGYRINKGKKSVNIDTKNAWAKLIQKIGGAPFAEACKLSIPQLVKPYKEATGSKESLANVRKELDEMLADCITTKVGKPFVEKS